MDHGSRAFKQPVVRDITFVPIYPLRIQLLWLFSYNDSSLISDLESFIYLVMDHIQFSSRSTAKNNSDRRRPIFQEINQMIVRFPGFIVIRKPIACDVSIFSPISRLGNDLRAEGIQDGSPPIIIGIKWPPG